MKRYINEFVRLSAAPDMLSRNLFPNAKEITESYGAFNACRSVLHYLDRGDSSITMASVGDGCSPRTAGLFAFMTAWNCFSIDPNLRHKSWNVKRLTCLFGRIEEYELEFPGIVVIVLVHSHATINACLRSIKGDIRHVISIPCCVPHDIGGRKYIGYKDNNIWSPKNTVKVWEDV